MQTKVCLATGGNLKHVEQEHAPLLCCSGYQQQLDTGACSRSNANAECVEFDSQHITASYGAAWSSPLQPPAKS